MDTKLKILATDGNYKHTLALIRDLVRVGPKVEVACSSQHTIFLSMFSHYCRSAVSCPDPLGKFDSYTAWLERKYAAGKYQIIIPVGSESNLAVSRIDPELVRKKSMVPAPELVQMASDKMATSQKMGELGVAIPHTLQIKVPNDITAAFTELSGDMVLKPRTGASAAGVLYITSEKEMNQAVHKLKKAGDLGYIAQQRIRGTGMGFFGLYDNGKRLAHFMHQRLREYPLSGGISVVAKSVKDEKLFEIGDSIFSRLKWNGVGMLEFKRSEGDGQFVLIEINPKFWGSLELALVSGVSFPSLMVRHILGESFPEPEYRDEITFNWTVPWNMLYFISKIRGKNPPRYLFGKNGHHTEYCPKDISPYLYQVALLPYYIYKEWHRL